MINYLNIDLCFLRLIGVLILAGGDNELPYLSSMKALFTSLILTFSIYSFAQENRFDKATYEGSVGSLNYRLLTPDAAAGRKFPLVVFLHGSGERGSDNEAQLKWGALQFASDESMKHYPAYVLAPQCPENNQWAAYGGKFEDDPTKPMKLLKELIDQLMKDRPIDSSRIYITGLSMGGFGTFDAMARYPDLFAAGIPVCGGGDPSSADRMKDIPIWIYTGAEDDVVVPERSLEMLDALMKKGAKPGYTQVPEVGHFSWLAAYSDELLIQWLFRQRKN